jgi:DNA-binding NtrC family response regulator
MAAWREQSKGLLGGDVVRERMRVALQSPPEDAELMLVLLANATILFANTTRISEAQRSLRLLRQLAPPGMSPLLESRILMAETVVMDRMGQKRQAHELTGRRCDLPVPPHCNAWCHARLSLAHTAINVSDFALAGRALSEVQDHPPTDPELLVTFRERQIRMMVLRGMAQEALALLDGLPPPKSGVARHRRLQYRVRSLLALGRLTEAQQTIDATEGEMPLGHREYLLAAVCLYRGDAAGAREFSRQALLAGLPSPVFLMDNALQMTMAELMAGQLRAARTILKMLDLDANDPALDIFWVQLFLLEGRDARAARHFRRILDRKDPLFLRESLRDAPTLNGMQIARLWTLAESLGPEEGTAATESDAAAAGRGPETVLVGESPAIREVRRQIAQFAPLDETVLITGETGAGKELAARLLHDRSPRSGKPFIAVNCAAISDTLIESELFGHVRGAFTGAVRDSEGLFSAAGEGTLFLDEISSMSARLQGALLRVLENGEIRPVGSNRPRRVKARVIAASNQPLEAMIERGEFRADLYYRLARLSIALPPLRARPDDIPSLIRHFLSRSHEYGEVAVGEDLLAALKAHDWPGNVREMRNELERIVLLSGGEKVLHAGLFLRDGRPEKAPPAATAKASMQTDPARDKKVDGAMAVGPAARPVRDRMRTLRELFASHGELTRAEAVKLLGCAPNSATRYLRMLEHEGLVERVETSASLRTSYFKLRKRQEPD